ncbi:hypothetical protein VB779_08830 [Haloarculaceae archaeon H-GB11]|nr:hypothetical protein [Haloarculaceae archaeon H-GB11]
MSTSHVDEVLADLHTVRALLNDNRPLAALSHINDTIGRIEEDETYEPATTEVPDDARDNVEEFVERVSDATGDVDDEDENDVDENDVDGEDDAGNDTEGADPEIGDHDDSVPEEYGVYTARSYGLALGGDVHDHFDSGRVTVRGFDGGADLIPGVEDDHPDYSVGRSHIQIGKPGLEEIGVEPNEEVRAAPTEEGHVRLEIVVDEPDGPTPEPLDEDDVDEERDRNWCGYCGAGPFRAADDVRNHHDREGHAGEPVVRGATPKMNSRTGTTTTRTTRRPTPKTSIRRRPPRARSSPRRSSKTVASSRPTPELVAPARTAAAT